jgi:hypothetical protein
MPPWREADCKHDKHYRRFCKKINEFWEVNASFMPDGMNYYDKDFMDFISRMF